LSEPKSSRRLVEVESDIGFEGFYWGLRREVGSLSSVQPGAGRPADSQRAFRLRLRDDVFDLPLNRNRESGGNVQREAWHVSLQSLAPR
jgi:hypothetical protein